jgi:hypothetical protein
MSDILTPDELRALAEALDRLKFRCDGIDDACLVEDAADYLRACADAKPVAWRTFDGEGNYDYRAHELIVETRITSDGSNHSTRTLRQPHPPGGSGCQWSRRQRC